MRVRTRRFDEAEQVPPTGSLSSTPLESATTRSSCPHRWRSSWPCAKDLCGSEHGGSLDGVERPGGSDSADAFSDDATVSSSTSECDDESTRPTRRLNFRIAFGDTLIVERDFTNENPRNSNSSIDTTRLSSSLTTRRSVFVKYA
jgi:hypothetical protein